MNPDLEQLVEARRMPATVATKLSQLEPGTACIHKSWGVGRVTGWDLAGDRMTIDFEDKPGHELKLEFAARSLEPLEAGHVLARRLDEAESLGAMAGDSPEEFVRLVLQSHEGRMMLDDFEGVVKGRIVPEGKFKSWWESTKKKLRADRRFVVPAKRTEALELRDEDLSAGDAMVSDFTEARDLKAKARAIEAILSDLAAFELPEVELQSVLAELEETISRTYKLTPGPALDLLLARDRLLGAAPALGADVGEGGDRISLADVVRHHRQKLSDVIGSLSVASLRAMFEAVPEALGKDAWLDELFDHLGRLGPRGVQEVCRFLVSSGHQAALDAHLRNGIQHRTISADLLAWVCKERKGAAANLFDGELASCILQVLERDYYDDDASRSNRLHDLLLNDRELVPDLMSVCDVNHARHLARRLMSSPVFEELNRRSLLARIVKAHPQVADVVSGEDKEVGKTTGLVVSWESLEERKKAYEKLVKTDIPENTKEIQIARSYGDLRENFEFKAAKQKQAVLMRLKDEMEQDLDNARGTDFANVDTSVVNIGTRVRLEPLDGGEPIEYTILGAWDTDLSRNIISYLSGMGAALLGRAVGEELELPSEEGVVPRRVRILSIEAHVTGTSSDTGETDDATPDA